MKRPIHQSASHKNREAESCLKTARHKTVKPQLLQQYITCSIRKAREEQTDENDRLKF
jgi:hypothetical protein